MYNTVCMCVYIYIYIYRCVCVRVCTHTHTQLERHTWRDALLNNRKNSGIKFSSWHGFTTRGAVIDAYKRCPIKAKIKIGKIKSKRKRQSTLLFVNFEPLGTINNPSFQELKCFVHYTFANDNSLHVFTFKP